MPVGYYSKSNDEYIKIAKELHYSKEVIAKLENAKSDNECTRIMNTARNNLK
ncbi:MAG: hypothetical protein LIO96_11750 [Lachnospiraceae bacterium]|nr:hypothetical protein [Lachnospiraceae bacterium]